MPSRQPVRAELPITSPPPARIAVTPGEPAGIGPDLLVRLVQRPWPCEIVAVADPALLHARAQALGLPLATLALRPENRPAPTAAGRVVVDPVALAQTARAGRPDPANAGYVLATLDRAVARCQSGVCAALVTGPVHKAVINDAGFAFSGHTDYLAAATGAGHVVMMLATPGLRVALATVHIPLAAVPAALTRERLTATISVLDRDLRRRFGIAAPRILVAGLNPHAGEGGYLGGEEHAVIEPVVAEQRAAGIDLRGPLPADTLFTPANLATADAVLAMYHDQGLPVIKHLGFGRTVNITLGMDLLRTSVDHGTAFDLVGSDRADPGSLAAALEMASDLAAGAGQIGGS